MLRRSLAFFLPAAVVLTVACGQAFVGLQQTLRMGGRRRSSGRPGWTSRSAWPRSLRCLASIVAAALVRWTT